MDNLNEWLDKHSKKSKRNKEVDAYVKFARSNKSFNEIKSSDVLQQFINDTLNTTTNVDIKSTPISHNVINDNTRVIDLTVYELKQIIRDVVSEQLSTIHINYTQPNWYGPNKQYPWQQDVIC